MSKQSSLSNGFTLVEMIVVIPMVLIVIGVIIGLMATFVNNVATSNTKTQLTYDAQDALSKIEQDTFYSLNFLSTFTPASPQDINNAGATAFTSATGTATSIILNEYATSNNPANSIREVIYYANRPQTCAQNYRANDPFYTKVIYFIKSNVLYRRVIVPTNNQNATPDANTTCAAPWQRNSCASLALNPSVCKTVDSVLVTGVSSLTLFYYNKAAPGTSVSPDIADSVKVTVNISKNIGGQLVSFPLTLAASQANAQSAT
jgi:type II secretory pathway pseudopilin PulG